ncbi:hypothetical protein BASA62_003258 [Batrachochytrium salamandrivorans]|nr:hypothetical protein BASA62_003258 [Batrachochytrium salamandrivorans]
MGIAIDLYENVRIASGIPAKQFFYVAIITVFATVLTLWMLGQFLNKPNTSKKGCTEPPMVPYTLPILGSVIPYGMDPVKFLIDNRKKYGDCFTFLMLGRKMTFCLGPDGNHFVFNIPLADASAEGAYKTLTTPVFGKGVVYDIHSSVFMQQKKFVKDAFSATLFRKYVSAIWEETNAYFKEIKENDDAALIFDQMSELTIRTSSHCLMGKEIRSQLHSNVAQLYHDLDSGLAPINVFISWLPLPVYIKRDRAHKDMSNLFGRIIKDRRARGDFENMDLLQTLMDSRYRDGSSMPDDHISHLMIAALMGGQHTSSTTVSWILYEIARRPDVIVELLREQSMVLTGKPDTPIKDLPEFDYEQMQQLTYLDCVMKETLRMHPPIHTIMRKVESDIVYNGFTIPAGNFLCGSAAVSQLDPVRFTDPHKFDPSRFVRNNEDTAEWTINGVDISQKSARSYFLPFGAGRHRCIGESFAYVQNKTIVSAFIRRYIHKLYVNPKTGVEVFPKVRLYFTDCCS